MTPCIEATCTPRHECLPSLVDKEKEKQLMVRFRQFRHSGIHRKSTHDMYCRIMCSQETQKCILSGNEDSIADVVSILFKTGLLLVGEGLHHTTFFFEEEKIFAETYFLHSIKI